MNGYKVLLFTLFFSAFLYLEHINFSYTLINTFFALSAFLLYYTLSKKELFLSGFFIGIAWFWWLSLSFIYYDLLYLIPFIIISIGLIYALFFYLAGFLINIYLRGLYLFTLSFIEPFGFNWFKPELLCINSFIGTSKIEFFILLLASAFFVQHYNEKRLVAISGYVITILSLLLFHTTFQAISIQKPTIKIKKYDTSIPQEIKWERSYLSQIVENNFLAIQDAIDKKYDLIVLPETAFPVLLNQHPALMEKLKDYSKHIAILTGSLYKEKGNIYNSSYLFDQKEIKIAHKVVLVPFGEAVPFPEKIANWINDIFYNGAKDYVVASNPTTFEVKNFKFRNAICYEATTDEIFQSLDTNFIIAISNNGWFIPSHQPTLQKLLMKYYEKKYRVKIISVTNQ